MAGQAVGALRETHSTREGHGREGRRVVQGGPFPAAEGFL
jgi:hypothetical protein